MLRGSLARRVLRWFPVTLLSATAGCFATRNDVRLVQTDIASLRSELTRADADQRATLTQALRLLQTASDSVAQVSARTVSIQGDVRGEMRSIKEQLLQIQQLLGQSQATIARLRAELAERANASASVPPPPTIPGGATAAATQPPSPVPVGGGRGAAVPAQATTDLAQPVRQPGSSELYQNGRDQLTRGSSTTARILFQELLTNYPTADEAPDAQFWIAESYAREKNAAAADAAYAAVVSKYANSAKAPTAVYKRAMLFLQQNNGAKARELFELVIARYPRSDEADLAAVQLKTLR